jgi:small subunit ribosomal protein S2
MAEEQIIEPKAAPQSQSQEMLEAGLHFGHKTSKTHPKMKQYISGMRNTIHLIDVAKTKEKLDEAVAYIKELKKEGKTLLLVGTKIQISPFIKEAGKELSVPYVSQRWIGGTLTNFGTIKKRAEYLKEMEQKRAEGELEKYTKKEQLEFDREITKLEMKFGGIKNMEAKPDAIFVFDIDENDIAVREAKKMNIPVIGIVDTNINPESVDYPIPANDDAVSAVKYIVDKVKEALK